MDVFIVVATVVHCAFAELRDFQMVEREAKHVMTAEKVDVDAIAKFANGFVQRTRNVTWRMAFLGSALLSFLLVHCGCLQPKQWLVAGMAAWIIIKSCLGLRNYHVEDWVNAVINHATQKNK